MTCPVNLQTGVAAPDRILASPGAARRASSTSGTNEERGVDGLV
jgi:hypothetical protein